MKYFSKIRRFDKSRYILELDLLFVEEDIVLYLEDLESSERTFVSNIKIINRKSKQTSDAQRKKWFVCISKILMHNDVPLTGAEIGALHYDLKISYFPCKFIRIGDKEIPIPPSINDLSQDEMRAIIERLIFDYTQYGVKFEED